MPPKQILLQHHSPARNNTSPNIPYNINRYHNFSKNRTAHGGGVSLYINKNLPTIALQLNTNLEAVAATVWYLNTKVTICNIYLPPASPSPPINSKNS